MTDEMKAIEYEGNYNYEINSEGYAKPVYQDIKQAYLDGLAEGRKELQIAKVEEKLREIGWLRIKLWNTYRKFGWYK